MEKITKQSLVDFLSSNNRGSEIIKITTHTKPNMKKTNNPFYDRVIKSATMNVNINFSYKNAVNNRLIKENKIPNFIPNKRKWGIPLAGTPFILNESSKKQYLNCRILKMLDVKYYLDNTEIDENLISQFLQTKSENSNQNLNNNIIIKAINVENIVSVKMRKKEYQLQ